MSSFYDIAMTQAAKQIEKSAGAVYSSAFLLSESVQDGAAGDRLTTKALLFYEGKHTDGGGKSSTFGKARLEKIVKATNAWIAEGRRIKLYASDADHVKIAQSAVIGYLSGELILEEITAENLPSGSPSTLVGKMGIFATASIAGSENVAQYLDGRLRELSIGLYGDRILEVSAVGVPALAGASLFNAELDDDDTQTFAVTLTDWMEKRRKQKDMSSMSELFEGFAEVVSSLDSATSEQLGGRSREELGAIAITDLASQLRGRLGVRDNQPLPMPNAFSEEQVMNLEELLKSAKPGQFVRFKANGEPELFSIADPVEAQTFAQQQKQFERERLTFSVYTKLKTRADDLVKAGKLTPAEHKQYFFDDEAAIAHFSMTENHDQLGKLEFHFEQLEKFGNVATFGSKLADEPLEDKKTAEQTEQEVQVEAERIVAAAQRFSAIF